MLTTSCRVSFMSHGRFDEVADQTGTRDVSVAAGCTAAVFLVFQLPHGVAARSGCLIALGVVAAAAHRALNGLWAAARTSTYALRRGVSPLEAFRRLRVVPGYP